MLRSFFGTVRARLALVVSAAILPALALTFFTALPFAAAHGQFSLHLASLVLVLLLAFLAVWLGGDRLVVHPIRRLAASMKRLAEGDLGARSGPPYPAGTLGQLGRAFDEMARRYQSLFNEMAEGFALHEIICDAGGNPVDYRFLEVNPSFERLTGLARQRVIGKTVREVLPAIESSWIETYGQVALTGKSADFTSYSRELKKYFRVLCFSPRPNWFATIFLDVTGEKEQEERLERQLHWIRILNSVSHSISERNTVDSILRVVMQHLEESFAFDLGFILLLDAERVNYIIHTVSSRGRSLAAGCGIAEGTALPAGPNGSLPIQGKPARGVEEMDLRSGLSEPSDMVNRLREAGLSFVALVPIDGEERPAGAICLFYKKPVSFDENERSFLTGLSEATAIAAHNRRIYEELEQSYARLKKAQESLIEQERLRAMGQMASGIAHDINNLLSPITLYAEALLMSEPHLSPKGSQFLKTIQAAARDIENTTLRLRLFYKKSEEEADFQPFAVNRLVEQVIELTRPRWQDMSHRKGIDITVTADLAGDLPPLNGIESEVREALLNLVFNAVDAMPGGGAIVIRTQALEPAEIAVEVKDTGEGMDEVQKRRCLEPFYTTKGEEGTGLGLSIVYGTMQRHRGGIDIESEPGKGTTIRLRFPILHGGEEARRSERPAAASGPLQILCIDDDEMVRESLKTILELEGHQVTAMGRGEEALREFRRRKEEGEPFAAVITDLGMPQMDGRQVAREIKRESPGTPVILLSGWGGQMNGALPENVDRVLGKPPKIDELRLALKALLEAKQIGEAE